MRAWSTCLSSNDTTRTSSNASITSNQNTSEVLRDQLGQRRLPFSAIDRSNGHGECFSTAHKYSQLLGSRHSRVDEVPKQHLEMLRVDRNDDRFKLTLLRFMD